MPVVEHVNFEELYEMWLEGREEPCERCMRMNRPCHRAQGNTFKWLECASHDCSWTEVLRGKKLIGGARIPGRAPLWWADMVEAHERDHPVEHRTSVSSTACTATKKRGTTTRKVATARSKRARARAVEVVIKQVKARGGTQTGGNVVSAGSEGAPIAPPAWCSPPARLASRALTAALASRAPTVPLETAALASRASTAPLVSRAPTAPLASPPPTAPGALRPPTAPPASRRPTPHTSRSDTDAAQRAVSGADEANGHEVSTGQEQPGQRGGRQKVRDAHDLQSVAEGSDPGRAMPSNCMHIDDGALSVSELDLDNLDDGELKIEIERVTRLHHRHVQKYVSWSNIQMERTENLTEILAREDYRRRSAMIALADVQDAFTTSQIHKANARILKRDVHHYRGVLRDRRRAWEGSPEA
ncbi:hypothetical protein C8Q78DRAFT_992910 [Trametes maxima]|nr:hypothetical protein C8Q78DRAFT_992910 [Trametes maxima]